MFVQGAVTAVKLVPDLAEKLFREKGEAIAKNAGNYGEPEAGDGEMDKVSRMQGLASTGGLFRGMNDFSDMDVDPSLVPFLDDGPLHGIGTIGASPLKDWRSFGSGKKVPSADGPRKMAGMGGLLRGAHYNGLDVSGIREEASGDGPERS